MNIFIYGSQKVFAPMQLWDQMLESIQASTSKISPYIRFTMFRTGITLSHTLITHPKLPYCTHSFILHCQRTKNVIKRVLGEKTIVKCVTLTVWEHPYSGPTVACIVLVLAPVAAFRSWNWHSQVLLWDLHFTHSTPLAEAREGNSILRHTQTCGSLANVD